MSLVTQTITSIKSNRYSTRLVRVFYTWSMTMTSKPISIAKAVDVGEQPGRVVYRDLAFISRVLVMRSGRTLHVSAHHVEAQDTEAQAFLDKHPDLERLPE